MIDAAFLRLLRSFFARNIRTTLSILIATFHHQAHTQTHNDIDRQRHSHLYASVWKYSNSRMPKFDSVTTYQTVTSPAFTNCQSTL